MKIAEFEDWLTDLPLQTLTDELKQEILEAVLDTVNTTSEETRLKINREVNEFMKQRSRK